MHKSAVLILSLLVAIQTSFADTPPPSQPGSGGISHFHWLGKRQLATNTNAANFIGIWNLPQSLKLQAQTLNKLSAVPWRLLRGESNNAAGAKLRPLLDDLVQEEWYAEIRSSTKPPGEMALAIRLNNARQAIWEANLSAVLESLTSIKPEPSGDGWSLKKHHFPNFLQLRRAGQWLVIGAADETNSLMADLVGRIQRDHTPAMFSATNVFLEADLDLAGLARTFSVQTTQKVVRLVTTASFEGKILTTKGEMTFGTPLGLEVEPWNIPVKLIDGSCIGFTAVRGVRPWLAHLENSLHLQIGRPPNQLYSWTMPGLPAQMVLLASLPDAGQQVHQLSARMMQAVNPWFATNDYGSISWIADGAKWLGMPFLTPSLEAIQVKDGEFALLATDPTPLTGYTLPPEMIRTITNRDNLVYYDWELTGPRIKPTLYIGQLLRMASGWNQIPQDSVGIKWLKLFDYKLGTTTTVISNPDRVTLSFLRKSDIGFTSIELQILVDWLESSRFPCGLSTFDPPPKK